MTQRELPQVWRDMAACEMRLANQPRNRTNPVLYRKMQAKAITYEACAHQLEAVLDAEAEARTELERKSRDHAAAIDDEMHRAGFDPDETEGDLNPGISAETWDAILEGNDGNV